MLAENIQSVQEKIALALTHRRGEMLTGTAVNLVAVTKNHPSAIITESLEAGIEHIGENRVQEAKKKQESIGKNGCWHLIGHLQSNKARQAVQIFDLIESVDSAHLLLTVDQEAARIGKIQEVLLQLNIAKEEQKSGFSKEEYLELLPKLGEFTHIRVRGLMVIAPLTDNEEVIRSVFAAGYRAYCRLKEQLPWVDILSMGMSGDYGIAIEEGSNNVRIGTALFGARDYSLKW